MSRFELRPSIPLAALLVLAHAVAGWSAYASVGGLAGVLLGVALAALGMAVAWSRALLGAGTSVRAIEIEGDAITLELADRARLAAKVAERRYVSRWLVTIPVMRPVRRTILVTGDMLDREAFRRLRLWTLWGRLPLH